MSEFEQEIINAVSAQKSEIVAGLIKATTDSVRQEIGWKIREAVAKEIGEWIETECLPEVRKQIAEKRVELIGHLASGISESFKVAAEALIKKCTENMARGWQVEQVAKAMFQ